MCIIIRVYTISCTQSLAHARGPHNVVAVVAVAVVVSGGSSRGAYNSVVYYTLLRPPRRPVSIFGKTCVRAAAAVAERGRPRMGWCESFRHVG